MKAFFAVACALVLGCATPPTLPLRPPPKDTTAAGPTAVRHETGSFNAHDGLPLFEQSWHPADKPRAILVAHHGLKDHSDRYAPFAERLVAEGLAVYAYDMRGHGRSAGPRATIDSMDDLLGDLAIFLDRVRAREPGVPIFLLGHSVGGLTVTVFALERRPKLAGLIVLAPAIRVDRMPLEAAATPVVVALNPNAPLIDVPNDFFLREPRARAEMDRSEFAYQPPGPARTGATTLDGIARVWARAGTLDVPLLALHGTADKATDPRGSAELVERAKATDKKLLLYRGVAHDLLHEPESAQITGDLVSWVRARLPSQP